MCHVLPSLPSLRVCPESIAAQAFSSLIRKTASHILNTRCDLAESFFQTEAEPLVCSLQHLKQRQAGEQQGFSNAAGARTRMERDPAIRALFRIDVLPRICRMNAGRRGPVERVINHRQADALGHVERSEKP